ncbi:MAG TPA: hypothetical protein VEG29_00300, partial [Candidatus Binatia bacterium]|nr:hypothetical protein [Candidatus Binatia bacterium]
PDELRGRVMSVYTTVFAGTSPFGGLLMGALAANAGAPAAIAWGGGISAAAAVLGYVWYRRIRGSIRTVADRTPGPATTPGAAPVVATVDASSVRPV